MRRGRPQANPQPHVNKPSPSPLRGTAGDPFTALDSKSPPASSDELSSRFPSLDQFSLMHGGANFDFNATSPTKTTAPKDLNQRIAEKLADEPPPPTVTATKPTVVSKAQQIISNNPDMRSPPPQNVVLQPSPTRVINNSYVSQGTMTSQTQPPGVQPGRYGPSPVPRLGSTDHHRSASVPRSEDNTPNRSPWLRPQVPEQQTTLPPRQASLRPGHTRHISSSRPSLEGGRPSQEVIDLARSKSNDTRPRPASTYLESNMDFLREKESNGRPSMSEKRNSSYTKESAVITNEPEETNIASDVDFFKSMEETESSWKDRRKSSGSGQKSKRSSLPSLSGTKNLLAGRFGDAFKRFEHNAPPVPRTPSPLHDLERRDLTPIAGSEATDGRSDDGRLDDADTVDLPPEQRRELERRRLSAEEKRVANAAAEYRKRVAERGSVPPPRVYRTR
jgi:AP2-associated kinase